MVTSHIADQIRAALREAELQERSIAPFRLSGRGHEPRVVLDRTIAAVVRSIVVERVEIAGFGPRFRYPRRVFERAAENLRRAGHTDAATVLRTGVSASSR